MNTVIYITFFCILVTFIASAALIPWTFALDSEQENVVRKWTLIEDATKIRVLENINDFHRLIENEHIYGNALPSEDGHAMQKGQTELMLSSGDS